MTEKITSEIAKSSNDLKLVVTIHDEASKGGARSPAMISKSPDAKAMTPFNLTTQQFKQVETEGNDLSLLGKVRGDGNRENIAKGWKDIKHSKLGQEKLEVFMKQAGLKVKRKNNISNVSLENEVMKTLKQPLFKDAGMKHSSSQILTKLLSLTEINDKTLQTMSTKDFIEKQKQITHQMTIDNRSKTAVVKNIVDKMIFKNNPDLGRANFFAQGYRDGTLE